MFMSSNLVDRAMIGYIQSPIDDIESFIWVTLYAKLKNSIVAPSPREKKWAEDFESDIYNRECIARRFGFENAGKAGMNTLIRKWRSAVSDLSMEYSTLVSVLSMISDKENGWENEEEEVKFWKAAWHGYALQGVCQSLELILAYIDR